MRQEKGFSVTEFLISFIIILITLIIAIPIVIRREQNEKAEEIMGFPVLGLSAEERAALQLRVVAKISSMESTCTDLTRRKDMIKALFNQPEQTNTNELLRQYRVAKTATDNCWYSYKDTKDTMARLGFSIP